MAMKLASKIEISDIPIIIALTLLGCAALLLIQEQEIVADEMAIYAYYLLVIGIAWKALFHLLTKQ
jgi:riboflavin transporter FmnP